MFGITVFVAANVQPMVLLYKGEDTQKVALEALNSFNGMAMGAGSKLPWATLSDDFGQKLDLFSAPLAILVQDMNQAREADIWRGIFNMVTQAKATDRAKADPVLVAHMRAQQQGPAVMVPNGMPRH